MRDHIICQTSPWILSHNKTLHLCQIPTLTKSSDKRLLSPSNTEWTSEDWLLWQRFGFLQISNNLKYTNPVLQSFNAICLTEWGSEVIVYTRSSPKLSLLTLPLNTLLCNVDAMLCRLRVGRVLTSFAVYCSPNSTPDEDHVLLDTIKVVSRSHTDCIILGDFNAPFIDWQVNVCLSNDLFSPKLLNTTEECFICQHVLQPTRFKCTQWSSLLNLIFSCYPNSVSQIQTLSLIGKSNHATLCFTMHTSFTPEIWSAKMSLCCN